MPTMNIKEFLLRKKKRKRENLQEENLVDDDGIQGKDTQQQIEKDEGARVKDDDTEICTNSAPIDLLSFPSPNLEHLRSPHYEKPTLSQEKNIQQASLSHQNAESQQYLLDSPSVSQDSPASEERFVSELRRLETLIEEKDRIINGLHQDLEDTRALERKAHDELLKARRQTLEYKERVFQIQLKFQRWDKLLQEWMERNRGKPKHQWEVRPGWDDNDSTPKPDRQPDQNTPCLSISATVKRQVQSHSGKQALLPSSSRSQIALDSVRSQLEKRISNPSTEALNTNSNHSRCSPDDVSSNEQMTQLLIPPDIPQSQSKDEVSKATSSVNQFKPYIQKEKSNHLIDPCHRFIDNDLTQLEIDCEQSAALVKVPNQDFLKQKIQGDIDTDIHNSIDNNDSKLSIHSMSVNVTARPEVRQQHNLDPSDLEVNHGTKAYIESINASETKPDSSDDEALLRDAIKLAKINDSVQVHSNNLHSGVQRAISISKTSEDHYPMEPRRVTLSPFTKPQPAERCTQHSYTTEGSETQWSAIYSKVEHTNNETQGISPSIESLEVRRNEAKILNEDANVDYEMSIKQIIPKQNHGPLIEVSLNSDKSPVSAPSHLNKQTDKDATSNTYSAVKALNGWRSNVVARAFLDEALDNSKTSKEPVVSNVKNPYKRVKENNTSTSEAIITRMPESNKSESSARFKSPSHLDKESQVDYKYVQVVRGKKKRECLPGHSCQCCDPFWAAVCDDNDVFDRKQFQDMSRHRGAHSPVNTPPHFWDLSFRDEVLARKKKSDTSDETAEKK
jgi:hypothetical protein